MTRCVVVRRPQRRTVHRGMPRRHVIRRGTPGPRGDVNRFFEPPISPTLGQTSFPLTYQPLPTTLMANVNGQLLLNDIDFTLSGSTLITLPALSYVLGPTDTIQISYVQVN